jgi:hypothetical protein
MSTMSLHCQNRVQRLRDFEGDTLWSSGSRGLAPGKLRSLLCPICSNPRRGFESPVDWDWQVLPVRLCESEPWVIPTRNKGDASLFEWQEVPSPSTSPTAQTRLTPPPAPSPNHKAHLHV